MAALEPLELPRALRNELLRLAQKSPREEICGLLAGAANCANKIYPVANVAGEPTRFFEMDPKGQIDALREMRQRGETLVAIYHSHPHGPALPSIHDVAQHQYREAACIVLTLDPPGLRAFRIAGETAVEISGTP